ncbi:MAG: hypothetical protein JRI25_19470 [Deltaproteobacteria bacterium]|nr:hypothetical protein [Deltaproteobacteria bacterium]
MAYDNHLYLTLFPTRSLVASQLEPESFARHYQVGSTRYYEGKLIFAEIDPSYRHDFLRIEWGFGELKPHEDGRPKATKSIASYRVLEHIAASAILRLYLSTASGHTLGLDPVPPAEEDTSADLRVYLEICPMNMLVLSHLTPVGFGRYIVDPDNPKGAPKMFFTQVQIDIDDFLRRYHLNPFVGAPVPGLHPSKLRAAAMLMKAQPEKPVKGISLHTPLQELPFRRLLQGYWFVSATEALHFPMPALDEIERRNFAFFRAM